MLVQRKATVRLVKHERVNSFSVSFDYLDEDNPVKFGVTFDDGARMRVKMTKAEARRLAEMLAEYGRY